MIFGENKTNPRIFIPDVQIALIVKKVNNKKNESHFTNCRVTLILRLTLKAPRKEMHLKMSSAEVGLLQIIA